MELTTRFKCPLMETISFELKVFVFRCVYVSKSCSRCLLLLDMGAHLDRGEKELPEKWRIDFKGFFEQGGLNI